tara:strand:+ start:16 stop:240 length:225 start_codon:yes stop_codon:yes gene_type:complete
MLLAKHSQLIYNVKDRIVGMQKNSAEETYAIEVDTVTGEYFVRIPEWIVNDQGWFEDTELKFKTDKSLIFIEEA